MNKLLQAMILCFAAALVPGLAAACCSQVQTEGREFAQANTTSSGRVEVSPSVVRRGEELTLAAVPPVNCLPNFFNISSAGSFTEIPIEFFSQDETSNQASFYYLGEIGRFGLIVTDADDLGQNFIGFACMESTVSRQDFLSALRNFSVSDPEPGVSVLRVGSSEIFVNVSEYRIVD